MHPNQTMLISGDRNGTINMWDLVSNVCAHAITPEPNNAIASVDVSRDGAHLAAATYNGTVYLWDLVGDMQHEPVAVTFFTAHSEYLLSLKFSPSCSVLLTTSGDNIAKLWSIPDGAYLKSFVGHQRWVWDSAFTYDSS
jgi:G protein beta subunit-like protein